MRYPSTVGVTAPSSYIHTYTYIEFFSSLPICVTVSMCISRWERTWCLVCMLYSTALVCWRYTCSSFYVLVFTPRNDTLLWTVECSSYHARPRCYIVITRLTCILPVTILWTLNGQVSLYILLSDQIMRLHTVLLGTSGWVRTECVPNAFIIGVWCKGGPIRKTDRMSFNFLFDFSMWKGLGWPFTALRSKYSAFSVVAREVVIKK